MRIIVVVVFLFLGIQLTSQSLEKEISLENERKQQIQMTLDSVNNILIDLKQQKIIQDLKSIGLPSNEYVEHSAMILEYSEDHEQAAWVAHMILPDITTGTQSRTNDFRVDPKVSTGTAIEQDYFLKQLQPDSTYEYDGYGYDRGHLAPSADFRWSKQALSESYYYSNISPQLPEFNRKLWAELEAALRSYVITYNVPLYVVTMPILNDGLPRIERSDNGVSIPDQFVKVAIDLENNRGIAFIMPNAENVDVLSSYAVTIDEAEERTSLNFFNLITSEAIESTLEKNYWFPELKSGDKEPLKISEIPKGYLNTVIAGRFMGNGASYTVCGNVVSSRYSRKGNLFMNLDKQFPNQIFSVFISKDDIVNFSTDIAKVVKSKNVCFKGKIDNFNQVPTIILKAEDEMTLIKKSM